MHLQKIRERRNSLVFRLSAVIALVLAVTLLLCIVITAYSYAAVNKSVVASMRGSLELGSGQIRNSLQSANNMLTETMADYVGIAGQFSDGDALEQYLASRHMASLLDTKMASNTAVDCVFFTDTAAKILLTRYQSRVNWDRKFALQDFLLSADTFENDAVSGGWHVVTVQGQAYFLQFFRLRYGGLGVLIDLSSLLGGLSGMAGDGNVQYLLTDAAGGVLASRGAALTDAAQFSMDGREVAASSRQHYVAVSMAVLPDSLTIVCLRYAQGLLYSASNIPLLFLLLSVAAVATVAASSLFLRRQIVDPIQHLIRATEIIEGGDLDYRIADAGEPTEFRTLITSFNYMTAEVKRQKIQTYEKEISRQKAELQYLQMQLKPHFYLNAISTISSLSMQGKNEEIQRFIVALSGYLRYLFTDNAGMSTVQQEIDHAAAFIELQQVKFPNLIFYMCEVEPRAAQVTLPKLLVQTFTENIFKHAFDGETMLSVFLRAEYIAGAENRVRITIEDNGPGFSAAFLAGQAEAGSVGIRNIRQTLHLAYGRDDLLQLGNCEQGGARVTIWIPDSAAQGGDKACVS